jgi:galactokinase
MHGRRAGKGVSSSAALEVSVMQALNVALELGLDGMEIAVLCQKVCRPSIALSDFSGCHHHCEILSLGLECSYSRPLIRPAS